MSCAETLLNYTRLGHIYLPQSDGRASWPSTIGTQHILGNQARNRHDTYKLAAHRSHAASRPVVSQILGRMSWSCGVVTRGIADPWKNGVEVSNLTEKKYNLFDGFPTARKANHKCKCNSDLDYYYYYYYYY